MEEKMFIILQSAKTNALESRNLYIVKRYPSYIHSHVNTPSTAGALYAREGAMGKFQTSEKEGNTLYPASVSPLHQTYLLAKS